jgi:hypothetical protein
MILLQRGLSAVGTATTIDPRFAVFLYWAHALRLSSWDSLKDNAFFGRP